MRRRGRGRAGWVSLDDAARLAAASHATIRGWVRRGSVRSDGKGDGALVNLEDVVTRAVTRRPSTDADALRAQVEAALTELVTIARELAEVEEHYTRREGWARAQHEREMREVYARWEQERSRWEQERNLLEGSGAGTPSALLPLSNGHVTTRPPVSDALLPPLHGATRQDAAPSSDITPFHRSRLRWRRS